ncbi:Ankyrin repeat protein 1 [Giardia muris]|uniref:Ankyrin repeat protein 1 n=1 Tax=Giardia muris TaxID=5742 RepID=A0A4Z1SWW5_GIAMU|nr:Ankyrin repeat protein 1 [Giardia muris]|eukprot:TNJ29335.1 Ankyrin repeat protein 1 [Giardia muris]
MTVSTPQSWFNSVQSRDYEAVVAALPTMKLTRTRNEETALMWAAKAGDLELVHLLAPAENSAQNADHYTALMLVALSNPPNQREVCLALAPFEGRNVLPDGRTALMLAAEAGCSEAVEALMTVSRYAFDKKGRTALTLAAENGHQKCVELLTSPVHGGYCYDARMAIVAAAEQNHMSIAQYLAEYITGHQPATAESQLGESVDASQYTSDPNLLGDVQADFAEVRQLVKLYSAETAAKDLALTNISSLLLEADAAEVESLNASLHEGSRLASSRPSVEPGARYDALLQNVPPAYHSVLITTSLTRMYDSDDSMTALMGAAYLGHIAVVEALINTECLRQNIKGQTALMIAIEYEHRRVIEMLAPLEYGVQDKEGWTALMLAAQKGDVSTVALLVGREAGIQANDGWSALMAAAYGGHLEVVRILAPLEAKLRDYAGYTAAYYAEKGGHHELARSLRNLDSL